MQEKTWENFVPSVPSNDVGAMRMLQSHFNPPSSFLSTTTTKEVNLKLYLHDDEMCIKEKIKFFWVFIIIISGFQFCSKLFLQFLCVCMCVLGGLRNNIKLVWKLIFNASFNPALSHSVSLSLSLSLCALSVKMMMMMMPNDSARSSP